MFQIYIVNFIMNSFSFHGLGPIMRINGRFNMNIYAQYLNQILGYIDGVNCFDDGVVYILHDNHPCHTKNLIQDWFARNIGDYHTLVIPHPM